MTKSKNTQTTSAVTTSTPQVQSFLAQPWQNYTDKVSGLLGSDPSSYTTPASTLQTSAFSRAMQGNGSVTPGLLSDANLDPYFNKYTQDVIDTSTNDLDRARRMAIVGNSAASAGAGANAWMGDRAGVADSETNRGFLDQVANLTANLRNTGFQNAQQGAMFDIGNGIDAQKYNIDARRQDTDQMANLGDQQRQIDAQNNPQSAQLNLMAAIQSLLSGVPIGAFTSQTGTQNGTTTQTSSPSLLSSLGGLALGAGSMGFSPFGAASVFKPSIFPTQGLLR